MPNFSNKTALVTGASQGIGAAIARSLHAAGAELILVGRSENRLQNVLSSEHSTNSTRPRLWVADLADTDRLTELADDYHASAAGLDILVNCGGVYERDTWQNASPTRLDEMFKTNVIGAYTLTRALLPALIKAEGDVVFVNSSIVNSSGAGTGQFKATQHALEGLADSLRAEANSTGLRVLSIYPGRTATPRQERIFSLEGRTYVPESLLQAEDVADAVTFCLSLSPTAEVTDLYLRPRLKQY